MDQETKQRIILIIEIYLVIISLIVFTMWVFDIGDLSFWMVGLVFGLTYGADKARAAARSGKI